MGEQFALSSIAADTVGEETTTEVLVVADSNACDRGEGDDAEAGTEVAAAASGVEVSVIVAVGEAAVVVGMDDILFNCR